MCWILRRMLQWTWIKTMLIFKLPMDHTCPLISCFLVVKLEWCDSVISSPTKVLNILQFPSPTNLFFFTGKFSSVQFSCSVVSDSLWPYGLGSMHTRLPCPSPTPRACSNSCPSSWWCHPTISFSVVPFSSCLQSFPASGSFLMSHVFASGDRSIGDSASALVLPMNTQDWSPLGWTGWISLQSKRLSRVFSSPTIWKHQFFGAQSSLWSKCHIHTWLLDKR